MGMDLASQFAAVDHIAPAVRTTTPTTASYNLATLAVSGLTMLLYTGAGGITFTGTNKLEWVVEHSNDGSSWTAVTAADLRSSVGAEITVAAGGIVEAYVAAKAAASIGQYEYIGRRQFVRATPTFGGTHATGTLVQALFLVHGSQAPGALN